MIDRTDQDARDERVVWICDCGCVSGWLHQDGTWECTNCGMFAHEQADMAWTTRHETPPVIVERRDAFKITDMNSSEAAYDRILRELVRRRQEVVGYMVLYASGNHSTWMSIDTEEELAWVKRHLDEVKEYADAQFQNKSAIQQARTKDRDGL